MALLTIIAIGHLKNKKMLDKARRTDPLDHQRGTLYQTYKIQELKIQMITIHKFGDRTLLLCYK